MCGIYGWQLHPGSQLSEYQRTLMALVLAKEMESRGRDSFGGVRLPVPGEGNNANIVRGIGRVAENGSSLFELASKSNCFLGHTRAATTGAVTIPNCHPFMLGDVLGVHNGVVRNHEALNKKYNRTNEVDSMHVFSHLDAKLDLADIYGYGTFFWSRSSEDWSKIYIAKTSSGSLSMAKFYSRKTAKPGDPDHVMMVWASEYQAIAKLAHLLNFEFFNTQLDSDKVYMLREGVVYKTEESFNLGNPHSQAASYEDYPDSYWEAEAMSGGMGMNLGGRGRHSSVEAKKKPAGCHVPNSSINNVTGKLTRKQKKALKKVKKHVKATGMCEDPVMNNVASGYGLEKVYLPINGKSGEATKKWLCPDCECVLDAHIWSWCVNNAIPTSSCKSENNLCNVPATICSDCGHYLLETVHKEFWAMGSRLVECTVCENVCAPEETLLTGEEEDDRDELDDDHPVEGEELGEELSGPDEQEMVDLAAHNDEPVDIKPTEIIVRNPQSMFAAGVTDLFSPKLVDAKLIKDLQERNGTL